MFIMFISIVSTVCAIVVVTVLVSKFCMFPEPMCYNCYIRGSHNSGDPSNLLSDPSPIIVMLVTN